MDSKMTDTGSLNGTEPSKPPTPRHHHYGAVNHASKGRPCTRPQCAWAIEMGLLVVCRDCR